MALQVGGGGANQQLLRGQGAATKVSAASIRTATSSPPPPGPPHAAVVQVQVDDYADSVADIPQWRAPDECRLASAGAHRFGRSPKPASCPSTMRVLISTPAAW